MAAVKGKLKTIQTLKGKYIPQLLISLPRGKALKLNGRIRRGRA
jgi:hypothetical protein